MDNQQMKEQGLDVKAVSGGPLDVNTYVIRQEGGEGCLLIDPGVPVHLVEKAVAGRRVCAVLLTHAHFDHMLYAEHWITQGAKLYVHRLDAAAVTDSSMNLSGMIGARLSLPEADVLLHEGDVVREAGVELTVLHTPGHTPGSVCYQHGNTLFSGDTLFYQSYGRIDLPGGNARQMSASLRRLHQLDAEIVAYPGHGMKTKIAWERGMTL